MKVIGFLLLEVILICIDAVKIRPVSEAHYWSRIRKYGPRRRLPLQLNAWRKYGYPSGRLLQLRNSRLNPYPKMKLDGVNARVIPLKVGKKAIQIWEKADYDIDYSRRPRMCPTNYIAKCYRSPYIEIKGRPARKCITLCKGKPCVVPCVCECKPKSKVQFSKAMIPHIVVPVDKRQLIPSCNSHQIVRCTAQIYGEATNELCAHGCGEGVCPLTCNCHCVGDRITRRQNIKRRISNFNNANRGPQFALRQNIASAVGIENQFNNFDNALPQSSINLENGIFLEGPGIGHAGNLLNSATSNDIIFDGVEMAAAGSRSGGGFLFSEGSNVVGGIQNNAAGSGGLHITDGQDGILLNNGRQNINMGGPADLTTDIVGEPIQLISPVDGTVAGPINLASTGPGPETVMGPLHGVETETVQVQIDVQSPGGHGGSQKGGAGNVGQHNANSGQGGPANMNTRHGSKNNAVDMFGGPGVDMFGGPGGIPVDLGNHINQINSKGSGGGTGTSSINNHQSGVGPSQNTKGQKSGADNLKLTIPGPKGQKGGAINLDLSGVLSTIPGFGAGAENGPNLNELGLFNQIGGNGGGEGLFQNQMMANELAAILGTNTEQGGGNGGLGLFGGSTLDGFGGLTGRSDTSPLSGLGSEMSFDALNFGADQASITSGGHTLNNGNNMASVMSQFLNPGSGRGRAEFEDRCLKGTMKSCTVTPEWRHTPGLLKWCNDTCKKGACDRERCKCSCLTQDELLLTTMI